MSRWLTLFGDEDRQRPLLHKIDATQDTHKIHNNIRDILEKIRQDKSFRRGFILELMAFKLKTMFEAKMKALLGDSIIKSEDGDDVNDSIGKEDELNATGDLS